MNSVEVEEEKDDHFNTTLRPMVKCTDSFEEGNRQESKRDKSLLTLLFLTTTISA
jgi:hypothetical protein